MSYPVFRLSGFLPHYPLLRGHNFHLHVFLLVCECPKEYIQRLVTKPEQNIIASTCIKAIAGQRSLTYFGSEKQFDNTEVINSPSPLKSASAVDFDLAATLASFAFTAAMAA
mmetsp:Transcript_520/g.959  ORF Transcript_520/g.959 Transcript_520/m.959 type:complete len:112 (+) Transcript_520:1697-2032(+)